MVFILLHTVFCFVDCQLLVTTIPPQISDSEGPVISAADNSTDINVYCNVTYNGDQFLTTWRLVDNDIPTDLAFNLNGTGSNPATSNFYTTGNTRNITIIIFDSSLDNTVLRCGSGFTFPGEFNLRIISKYFHYYDCFKSLHTPGGNMSVAKWK